MQPYLIGVALCLLVSSCLSDDFPEDKLTSIDGDLRRFYLEKGTLDSDTVIIYSQGGPLNRIFTFANNSFHVSGRFHEVYVHESNTINGTLINRMSDVITMERAEQEVDISADILYKVSEYFISQKKTVYMLGESFGAYLMQNMLVRHKPIARKYMIGLGRFQEPEEVWQNLSQGKWVFYLDAQMPVVASDLNVIKNNYPYTYYSELSRYRLIAALVKHNFLEELKDRDLSSLIYIYGNKDEVVGRLTDIETKFLLRKGAKVYEMDSVGHSRINFYTGYDHTDTLLRMLTSP